MITRAVNAAADVIHRAQVNGAQTAAGLACALDSARMLMSPEVAAELDRLRSEVAALRDERCSTNEALDDAVQELRARRDDEAALPWAHTMSDDDLHGFLGDLVSAAVGRWQHSPEVPDREVLAAVEKACARWRTPGEGYRSDEDVADGITRVFAPTQALRGRALLDAVTVERAGQAHRRRLGLDLPETDGA